MDGLGREKTVCNVSIDWKVFMLYMLHSAHNALAQALDV